jgi:nucleotide-binding universal stress UspA family protein
MATGHVPVLALPKGTRWSAQDREGLVLMAADDLEQGSEPILKFGLSLAATRQDLLIHCHVNAPQMWHFNDQVIDAKDRLTQRAQRFVEATPSHGYENYKPLVLDGDVNEAIERAANEVDADLIIFGRHRPVRVAPLRLGRVPLHAMLTHGRPVAVVPMP